MHWTMGIVLLAACSLESTSEVESSAQTPPLTISPRATAIGEAGDNAFIKITMTARPMGPVTLSLSSSHPGEAQLVPSSVTFTPRDWSGTRVIEVVPVDDAAFDGDVPIQIEARIAQGAYAGFTAHVDVLSVDDDYEITGFTATKFVGEVEAIPVAINNRGQIALDIRPETTFIPHLWDAGTLTDLNPAHVDFNRATGINDNGAVIGTTSAFGPGSFVWENGALRPAQAWMTAINELDHEAGSLYLCDEVCHELVHEESGIAPWGLALNNRDQITGRARMSGGAESAFYWQPSDTFFGDFVDLGGAPRGEGLGINEHGAAVGRRFDATFTYQAFLYENGTITELGTATGTVGGTAMAINDRGDIVGSDYDEGRLPVAGWIGRPGNLRSLQSLIVDGTCFTMLEVIDVNNRGQIIARGWECDVGMPYAFLLEPVKTAR